MSLSSLSNTAVEEPIAETVSDSRNKNGAKADRSWRRLRGDMGENLATPRKRVAAPCSACAARQRPVATGTSSLLQGSSTSVLSDWQYRAGFSTRARHIAWDQKFPADLARSQASVRTEFGDAPTVVRYFSSLSGNTSARYPFPRAVLSHRDLYSAF